MSVEVHSFGMLPDGRMVQRFLLTNVKGTRVEVTNYGAILLSLWVKDNKGVFQDVVLGYEDLVEYLDNHPMFGATVGRCVNRISNASFYLDGIEYQLKQNRGRHNIHSDKEHGFHKQLWDYEIIGDSAIRFYIVSPDGDQGFPGTLRVSLTYTLSEADGLILSYYAETDQKTIINLSNHSYFNLAGHNQSDILDTQFTIHADAFTPIDKEIIPTGELRLVQGTPMDFTKPDSIRNRLYTMDPQLCIESGYDHNYVIHHPHTGLRCMASAMEPSSGIRMAVYGDLPGLQFYTGNSLTETKGKHGMVYERYSGFCMEPQFFPNSINTEGFEKPIFDQDHVYRYTTIYQFY